MCNLAFKLGANVYGRTKRRTKHCGQLIKIVIDPRSWQLTDLIIEEGLLFKRALVLPIAQVQVKETLKEAVILTISSEQLKQFQVFDETIVEKGISDWPATKTVGEIEYASLPTTNIPNLAMSREKTRLGVRNDAVILDNNTNVACLDGNIGHLSHIMTAAKDYLISNLVFKQGTLFPKYYIVSSPYIDSLSEAQVQIGITGAEAEQLPEYTFLHNN